MVLRKPPVRAATLAAGTAIGVACASIMRTLRIAVALALAAGAVAGGLVASAAPASADVPASNPIQYVSEYFWSGGANTVVGTASCPSGSRVVSSGATAAGGSLVGIAPDINSFTSATAAAHSVAEYLVVTVGCMSTAALSEVTTRTIQLPYGKGARQGTVSCPAGMRAFGGGGYMVKPFARLATDSSGMTINTVTGSGASWTYEAYAADDNTAPVITTQCAPLRGSYVTTASAPATVGQRVDLYGSCLPGYTALSGGMYLTVPGGAGFIDYSMAVNGNSWYVRGLPLQYNKRLIARVQCIR